MESALYCGMESAQGAGWNHGNAVYGIKQQEDARWRVMICTALCAAMIYQACGLDKQKQNICLPTNVLFLLVEKERSL